MSGNRAIEKRRTPRRRPAMGLDVVDAMTGEVAGRLGNVSAEGMMLIARAAFVDGGLYQFGFRLPDSYGHLHPVDVGVQELWSEAGSVPGQRWVGFRFIDVGSAETALLREWTALGAPQSSTTTSRPGHGV